MNDPTGGIPRNCVGCPSYLKTDEASQFFRRSVGAPMCATFGHVLGKPGGKPAAEAALAKHYAEDCMAYGKPRPDQGPERPSLLVSSGDLRVVAGGLSTEEERRQVTTCRGCANLVADTAVASEMGWPTGLCAAQGRLILQHRQQQEAANCNFRKPGANRTSTEGIDLLPIYEDAFGIGADPVTRFLKNRGKEIVDPTVYPTDREVTPEDIDDGIRAWRKIESTDGSGRFTFLPIFETSKFTELEQAKIPRTGDDEMPEAYVDHSGAVYKVAVLWMELDETPALWGMAGTGKTEFFRHVAWLMNLPFDRISITESSEVDDLFGSMRARATDTGTETFFHYGRVPTRWQLPGVFVLDEPNTGPDAVWQAVRPLTDNSKQLVLDQNNAERLSRNSFCFFGMAMNPAHDVRNVGARPLADADGNRLMHIMFDLPPEPLERAIIEDRCAKDGYDVPKAVLDTIMKIAVDVRQASEDETIPISWGIRPQIKVARASRWFDLRTCYRIGVADSLDPEAAAFVLEVVNGYVDPETGAIA
jgi:MoxR-like ATPase